MRLTLRNSRQSLSWLFVGNNGKIIIPFAELGRKDWNWGEGRDKGGGSERAHFSRKHIQWTEFSKRKVLLNGISACNGGSLVALSSPLVGLWISL